MDLVSIKKPLEDKLATMGYELCSLSYVNRLGGKVLEVVIDRVEPIDMNTIVDVSEQISAFLDEIDNSEEAYTLDVSSLGAEKPLKISDLNKYVNSYVNVHLINPINGENIYEGEIKSVDETSFILLYKIKTRVKEINILFDNIYKIRLAVKF